MALHRVCVYCGSSPGRLPIYREAAAELGRVLVQRNIALVYGGAGIGVMGAIADAVMENGGEAIGVIPQSLATREVAHTQLSELIVVTSMHERKAMMAELSDAFVALPGGWGTFEELFEMLTWAQLGIHQKPCGVLNVSGYYDHLSLFLQHAMDERFVREEYQSMMIMEQQPEALLDRFNNYQPPQVHKWIEAAGT